jgi:hypothetical protein
MNSQPFNDDIGGVQKSAISPNFGDMQLIRKEIEMTMMEQTFTNLKKSLYIYKLENVSRAANQAEKQEKAEEPKKQIEGNQFKQSTKKKPDDLGSNWDGATINTQGTGFKFKPGNDALVKNFSFDIIPQDQRYQIMYGSQVTAKTLMKEAFYYAEENQVGKNELIQRNLDKRLKRLQEVDVRLMKLRRGVLIPEMDQDNWDRPDDPELEQIINLTMEGELREAEEIVEEEIRANEIELLLSGKRELEKKLIKTRTSPTVFWTFLVGLIYTIVTIVLLSVEYAMFFQHVSAVKSIQQTYLQSGQQLNSIGLLLLDLQLYPLVTDATARSYALSRMISNVEQSRNLKTTLMQSSVYFSISETSRSEILIGQVSGNTFRINEILDQVLGKSILLFSGIKSSTISDAQMTMQNETFYYIVQNSLTTLIPTLQSTQSSILNSSNTTNTSSSWTFWIGGVEFFIALCLTIYMMWFLKNSTKDLEESLSVFLEIPDYNLRSYLTQAEYFVLLFIGDETNHIDDLKTEVNAFRKLEEKGYASNLNTYQRKQKLFVQGKLWNSHSMSFLFSLIIFPCIYTIIAMITTTSTVNRVSSLIDFTSKLSKRPQAYDLSLNLWSLSLISPSTPINGRNSLEYLGSSLPDLYNSEEDYAKVDH